MAKYRVGTAVVGFKDLGIFEADSEEEAIEKAFKEQGCDVISLCYHCSNKVGELLLSDKEEDIEVELVD